MTTATLEQRPGASPSHGAEDVLGLLRRQAALFARLEQFAARQRVLVRADDAGPLLSLLADRQRLSSELTGIAAQLAPVRAQWSAFRDGLGDSQRVEADGLLRDCSARLRRVIDGDEADARLLSVKKQAAASDLRTAHATGEALSAYRAPAGRARETLRLDEST